MGYAILLVITILNVGVSVIIKKLIKSHRYETRSETEKHLTNYQVFALTFNTGLISFFANIKITAWDFCPMLDIISYVPLFNFTTKDMDLAKAKYIDDFTRMFYINVGSLILTLMLLNIFKPILWLLGDIIG